jgi:histidinol-phosphate aminotransferase
MKFDINKLVRPNVKMLSPYSSARSEFKGKEGVFLDANENPYRDSLYNRYPDPLQSRLKERIAEIKNVKADNIFIGNGSDEAIDLLIRAFCEPANEKIIICPPTYGMYEVCANINNVSVIKVPLTPDEFQLNVNAIMESCDEKTKILFVCCPNNPTGNGVKSSDIHFMLKNFKGLVVVDEAYIDFASYKSLLNEINNFPNLVILQTLSKAWGLAGLRIGMAFAKNEIIEILNKIKPPYNVNESSQQLALQQLSKEKEHKQKVQLIIEQREVIRQQISYFSFVKKIYPSEANFLLVKVDDAQRLYQFMINENVIIRNRSNVTLCENCIRVTIGTEEENTTLINALKKYQ